MGIASFVIGIVALLLSATGAFALIVSIVGLPLGIVSLVKKKHKGLSIAGIAISSVALVIALSVCSSTGNNIAETATSVKTEQQEEKQTTNEKTKKEYCVGEIFKNSSVLINYISADDNFTGYSRYADVKEGYKVIKAEFEFENTGNSDFLASAYDFNCYADGYDCDNFWSTDDSGFSSTLSSGKKTKGNVYFEVPENATDITLEYELNVWSSNKVIFRVK